MEKKTVEGPQKTDASVMHCQTPGVAQGAVAQQRQQSGRKAKHGNRKKRGKPLIQPPTPLCLFMAVSKTSKNSDNFLIFSFQILYKFLNQPALVETIQAKIFWEKWFSSYQVNIEEFNIYSHLLDDKYNTEVQCRKNNLFNVCFWINQISLREKNKY